VLLVEDSPSVRQVETFILQDAGFVVDVADDVFDLRKSQLGSLVLGLNVRRPLAAQYGA